VSAQVTSPTQGKPKNKSKSKENNETDFTITTSKRTYFFRADSEASAEEWVNQIQKVIFRLQNEEDTVKVLIPINNVLDIEQNPIMNFVETIRIRVLDNHETYALDEVIKNSLLFVRFCKTNCSSISFPFSIGLPTRWRSYVLQSRIVPCTSSIRCSCMIARFRGHVRRVIAIAIVVVEVKGWVPAARSWSVSVLLAKSLVDSMSHWFRKKETLVSLLHDTFSSAVFFLVQVVDM